MNRLSSSIHTIHRPLARSHRVNIPDASQSSVNEPLPEEDDVSQSDEELGNDFEETPRPPNEIPSYLQQDALKQSSRIAAPFRAMQERSGSMATVRVNRRARLAEKLKEVYDLDDIREVWAGVSPLNVITLSPIY